MLWLRLADHDKRSPVDAQDPEGQDDPDALSKEVTTALRDIVPWAASFLIHAALVILTLFVVWTIRNINQDQIIIPIARLSEKPGEPLSMKATEKIQKELTERNRSITDTPTQSVTKFNKKVDMKTQLIGVVGSASAKSSPFGTTIGPRGTFKASFFGTFGNARRLVYLVDASGSLIDSLPFVTQELKRSIDELSDKQMFTVIFFQNNEAIEVPPAGMMRATAKVKARVIKWINPTAGNITPMGQSNPIKAVKLALRYKAQLMFILSDNITGAGRYEINQAMLLREIDEANVGGTKINTIQFLYPDPLTRVGLKGTLEMIARNTGGIYKFVDARELGIR